MNVTTPRFGTLSFGEEQMMFFPYGIHALPQRGHFLVVDAPSYAPFQWLVCVEQPERAWTVLDPAVVLDTADPPRESIPDTTTFVVATPGSGDVAWWLDLRHPIVINTGRRTGEQVTLDDSSLPDRFPVTLQPSTETAE